MHTIIVFDLDGTLLDTSPGIFATANHTMKTLGFSELPDSQLRKFVGPPLAACFRIACGLEEKLIADACRIYREEYGKGAMYLAEPYDGVVQMLEGLKEKGCTLLVATLKHEDVARKILEKKGLLGYFRSVKGSDSDGLLTKKDIIINALEAIGEQATPGVLMVGDTPHDMDGAREAGVDFLAVDWGFGFHRGRSFPPHKGFVG